MPNWKLTLHTAGNNPQQFFDEEGEVFLAGAQRVSGPLDNKIPRRCIGTGRTRAQATQALVRSLSAHDRTYRIVSSRQTPSDDS